MSAPEPSTPSTSPGAMERMKIKLEPKSKSPENLGLNSSNSSNNMAPSSSSPRASGGSVSQETSSSHTNTSLHNDQDVSMDVDGDVTMGYAESECSTDSETEADVLGYYQKAAEKATQQQNFHEAERCYLRIIDYTDTNARALGQAGLKIMLVYTELEKYTEVIKLLDLGRPDDPTRNLGVDAEEKARTVLAAGERMVQKRALKESLALLMDIKGLDIDGSLEKNIVIPDLLFLRTKVLLLLEMYGDALLCSRKTLKAYKKVSNVPEEKIKAAYRMMTRISEATGSADVEAYKALSGAEALSKPNEKDIAEMTAMLSEYNLGLVDGQVSGTDLRIYYFMRDMMRTRNFQRFVLFCKFWSLDRPVPNEPKHKDAPPLKLIHLTAYWSSALWISHLLSMGCPVDMPDGNRRTALHYAAQECTQHVLKVLLDAGANPNARDDGGWTPLHVAAEAGICYNTGSSSVMLLEAGAYVNATDQDGQTPLHFTCGCEEKYSQARLLLDRGADINQQDGQGNTPLHVAISSKRECTAEFLLNKGADASLRNYEEKTPADLATNKKARKLFADPSSRTSVGDQL